MLNRANVIGDEMLLRVANLGTYATVLAIATLAERIADNGVETTAIVEVSHHPDHSAQTAAALRYDKALLFATALGILAIVAAIVWPTHSQWLISSILTLRTFSYSFCRLNTGMLKALDKSTQIARIQALHCGLLFICLALGRTCGAAGVACSIVLPEAVMGFDFLPFWKLPKHAITPADPEFATLLTT
jgi:O-antigen/teichoic acid export membrane protein